MFDANDRQFIFIARRMEAERPSTTRRMAFERELSPCASSGSSAPPTFIRWLRAHVTSAGRQVVHRQVLAGSETKA
jgi:hypothetical protein